MRNSSMAMFYSGHLPLPRAAASVSAALATVSMLVRVGKSRRPDSKRPMVPAGHYAGTTSQGEPISFDVSDAGSGVTNVIVLVDGPLQGIPNTTISISQTFPIDEAGRWGGVIHGAGVRVRIRGRVTGPNAAGTVRVALESSRQSSPPRDSTPVVPWRAHLVATRDAGATTQAPRRAE